MTNAHRSYFAGRKALVTGGAGFIGSYVTEQLVARGAEVVVIDNLATGSRENLASAVCDGATFVELDIRDTERMTPLIKRADIVLHLACLGVRHSLRYPLENHDINATATLSLVQLCQNAGVERFVHVSTSEVYGTATKVPMKENHPTLPHTVYGASKLAGESYARAAYLTSGLEVVVIRPFNAFGPRSHHEADSGEVIPRMMLKALAGYPIQIFGTGKQTRDFTYVEDTARGILMAAASDSLVGRTVNLGSGAETEILTLADKIRQITGAEVDIDHFVARPGDLYRLCADSDLLTAETEFATSVSLERGLEKLRDWYLESGVPVSKRLEQVMTINWR